MFTVNALIQLSFLLVYSLEMVTGEWNPKYQYIFITYRLQLLIPPSNTMLKLLVILLEIKLYAKINML